jgi:hypothetical protein
MWRRLRIGLIQGFTLTFDAVFMPLKERPMMTSSAGGWDDTKGGMRFAFPPYGPCLTGNNKIKLNGHNFSHFGNLAAKREP